MSYEVWTHDSGRPELLTTAPDKGVARRAWSQSRHAAIFVGGEYVEEKTGTGVRELRALRLAAERQHREGPPAVEPTPVVDDAPKPAAVLLQLRRALDAMTRERDEQRGRAEGLESEVARMKRDLETQQAYLAEKARKAAEVFGHDASCHTVLHPDDPHEGCNCLIADVERGSMGDVLHVLRRTRDERDTARRDAAAHLVRAVEAEQLRDRAMQSVTDALARRIELETLGELLMTEGLAACEVARARVRELDAEVINEGDRAARAEAEVEQRFRGAADDYQRGKRDGAESVKAAWAAMRDQRDAARTELEQLRAKPAVDEDLLARVATQAARVAVRATREDLRLRALAATFPGGVDELERIVLGYADLLRQAEGRR